MNLFLDIEYFKNLEYLKLRNCGIDDEIFTKLCKSNNFRRLEILILSKNLISNIPLIKDDSNGFDLKRRMKLKLLDLRENKLKYLSQID